MTIDRTKLAAGPAITVAARAQSGAPGIVWRRSCGGMRSKSFAAVPLAAFSSPRNLTYPPSGSAAICQRVPRRSVRAQITGPKPSENTSALIPHQRPTM